jgi:hypothetical protein
MRLRPTSSAALALLILASILLPCFDFCPEEEGEETCPPVCASCIGCPRSPVPVPALDHRLAAPAAVGRATSDAAAGMMPLLSDDILHVPLAFAS